MTSKVLCFFLFITICVSTSTTAQDLNAIPSDLSSVNVDALSDEQVQRFIDAVKQRGLSLDQLEIVAKQRGMSASQVSKLRSRIRQIQLSGSRNDSDALQSSGDRLREGYQFQQEQPNFLDAVQEEAQNGLPLFGSEIFRNAELTFEPSLNVATPESYVLGPGDEVIIDVYGASEITYQEVISPEGRILISGVGPISLGGISLTNARNRIFNRLSTIYSGVKGRNPNTFIEVSVGSVRSIKVNVVGNVRQPGTYTLSSFSTAFNALYYAGGPSASGSYRSIDVMRSGEKIASLDIYKYLYEGDESQNPSLQDQDVIVVNPYLNRVKLAGNIKRPAVYELVQDESITSLIATAGGFTGEAFKDRLTIDRITDSRRSVATIVSDQFDSTILQDGDSIFVDRILDLYQNRVLIEGAVRRAGAYELTEGLMLSDLIQLAEGLREDAFIERGNIIRQNDDLTLNNLSFEVAAVMEGQQDIALSPNDIVRISSVLELNEAQTVTLQGEVNRPGRFPFIDGMTVEDVVNVSGGLKNRAHEGSVEIARRLFDDSDLTKSAEIFTFPIQKDLGIGADASGFQLEPFDLVIIKSTSFNEVQKVVKIEGEVMFPGFYALESNEDKISDLIARAGGLTRYGYAKGATLIRRTEYFRSAYEKQELQGQIERKRQELEKQYEGVNFQDGTTRVEVIRRELADYEKELTEDIRKKGESEVLESRLFRAQELRKLQLRDSISGSFDLVEQEGIGIELDKILKNPKSVHNLILKDGDLISIPQQLQTVKIQGEVLYPNTLSFQSGIGLKQYVSLSGGFSDNAKPGKAYVVYANGRAQRTKKFLWFKNYPDVEPGADIFIPQKQGRRRLSSGEVLGITSGLASISLVILQIINISNQN